MTVFISIVLLHFVNIISVHAADPPQPSKFPIVETIEGAKSVISIKGKSTRLISAGEEIVYGEKIRTTETSSAVIRYPDGSKVVIARKSDFTIESQVEEAYWNRLHSGSVRGIIKKPAIPPPNTKPRFLIRSKAAVLGVRGTDFVMAMNTESQLAQINTLEGSVEVAKNELSLLNGEGTVLNEGQFIQSSQGAGALPAPKPFNKTEFIKSFESSVSGPSSATPPPGTSEASAATSQAAIPSAAVVNPAMPAPSRIPPPAPPANVTPEEIQKVKEEDERRKEEEGRKIRLLVFQAGMFFTNLNNQYLRAITAAWTPEIPIPLLSFLTVRGNFGGSFALQGSLYSQFMVADFQIFATATFLNFIFAEVGIGEQIWRIAPVFDAQIVGANVGLVFKSPLIDRVFIGYHSLDTYPRLAELKAGIGISF